MPAKINSVLFPVKTRKRITPAKSRGSRCHFWHSKSWFIGESINS
jgi:hypothetical protein